MARISAHFFLEEIVPPEIYNQYGEKGIQFIDQRIINILEYERNHFGRRVFVNNWHIAGATNIRTERGFRRPNSLVGGNLSQHKFGRAADRNIEGISAQEHYQYILDHPEEWINRGLTTMENIDSTPSWLHSDVRNTSGYTTGFHSSGILIVNP